MAFFKRIYLVAAIFIYISDSQKLKCIPQVRICSWSTELLEYMVKCDYRIETRGKIDEKNGIVRWNELGILT